MATASGSAVTTAGGTFRLKVDYSYTTTAIKFMPFIVVTNSFDKPQPFNVKWVNTSGKWVDHKKYKDNIGIVDASIGNTKIKEAGTYYVPDKNYKTNGDYQITIKAIINGKTSEVTLTSDIKPSKPTISIKYVNDAHIDITVKGSGKKAVPSNNIYIQRQDLITSASWESIKTFSPQTTGSYKLTYSDQTVTRGERYRYRARVSNAAGSSGYVTSSWVYTNPPEVSNVAHVRNSNFKCTVSWDREIEYVDRSLITSYNIQRSQSGGAWVKVGSKTADKTAALTERYEDKTTSTNEYYSYRIKPVNSRGVSPIAYEAGGTDVTYNTPAAPSKITAVYTSTGDIILTLINPEKTATALEIERSLDGGATWSFLDEVDETTDPAITYTDDTTPTGSGIQYRARNTRDALTGDDRYSAWTVSNTVQTISQPEPPTLIQPVNGTPIVLDEGDTRLAWVHNPTDGTPQEAAQIQYYVNDSYIATITVANVSYYNLTLNPQYISANDIVTWRVRTKGAYASYSEWSGYNEFKALTRPQIAFTAPDNGDVITNLPLELAWTYNDDSGLLQALTLDILSPGGDIVYTELIPTGEGASGDYSHSLAGYLFDNDTSYALRVTALSTSGLTAIDNIGISIEYDSVRLQDSFFVDPEIDNDNGIVDLLISVDESPVVVDPDPDAEEPRYVDSPVDHASLYRVVNGKRVLLSENVQAGDQLRDMYAPLNSTYQYELIEVATTGEVAIVNMDVTLDSVYWYVYWGDNIARAIWDPNGAVSLTRPERQQIRYSGRKYPVTYDSKAIEETYNFSGIIDDPAELDAFRRLIQDGGQGVWKSCDGQVYMADFDYSYSADYTVDNITWSIDLSVTRIDSEEL